MNIDIKNISCDNLENIIVPVLEDNQLIYVPDNTKSTVVKIIDRGQFKGTLGEIFFFTNTNEDKFSQVLLIGLGKKNELTLEKIRIAYSKALRKSNELKLQDVYVKLFQLDEILEQDIMKSIVEGMALSNYTFLKYKNDKKENTVKNINLIGIKSEQRDELEKSLKECRMLIDSVYEARNLINEPANCIYPESLSEIVRKLGKNHGFEVEVLNEEQIKELKMDAFMSVAKGSSHKPRFIIMRYLGDEDNKDDIIGLVGKGLTYDAGGYSLKSPTGMITMKTDMAGAGAVIGLMMSISKMKLKKNVISVIAACENLVSGESYKPGDIISSMAGKTIEVLNTDAEGRLTLIDGIHYIIDKEKATKVIDIATLTGAVVHMLGSFVTGVVTNNDDFYSKLEKASETSGERMYKLPVFDEYKELIQSDIADLKNTGGKYAGAMTAGLFIGEFAQDKPWLHLDIAGTADVDTDKNYLIKGATGVGVRTLYYLIKDNL